MRAMSDKGKWIVLGNSIVVGGSSNGSEGGSGSSNSNRK